MVTWVLAHSQCVQALLLSACRGDTSEEAGLCMDGALKIPSIQQKPRRTGNVCLCNAGSGSPLGHPCPRHTALLPPRTSLALPSPDSASSTQLLTAPRGSQPQAGALCAELSLREGAHLSPLQRPRRYFLELQGCFWLEHPHSSCYYSTDSHLPVTLPALGS